MSTNTIFGDLFGSAENDNASSTLSEMINQSDTELAEESSFNEEEEITEQEETAEEEETTEEETAEEETTNLLDNEIDENALDRRIAEDDYDISDLEAGLEFADNMDPRAPVVIVADASGSMAGEPLDELNKGIRTLFEELKKDELAKRRVELSVISYGTTVKELTDFTVVEDLEVPNIELLGLTSTGEALEYAIDKVEERKEKYRSGGIEYYRPIILLITDGAATDELKNASKRLIEGEASRKFVFFPVGVKNANMSQLNELSTKGAMKLQGYKFNELFKWLSASVQAVSASTPGDKVALPDISGWMSID